MMHSKKMRQASIKARLVETSEVRVESRLGAAKFQMDSANLGLASTSLEPVLRQGSMKRSPERAASCLRCLGRAPADFVETLSSDIVLRHCEYSLPQGMTPQSAMPPKRRRHSQLRTCDNKPCGRAHYSSSFKLVSPIFVNIRAFSAEFQATSRRKPVPHFGQRWDDDSC